MGPAPAPHTPGNCEAKAQLECSYKDAEAAFDTARTAIRQKVGKSSKYEYFMLACRGSSLVPPPACREGACYTHSRTRMRNNPGSFPEPQTDLVKQLPWGDSYRTMACKTCDELLAAYKREVRLFMNVVLNIPGRLRDDSRMTPQEWDRLSQKCRSWLQTTSIHLRPSGRWRTLWRSR